MTTSGGDLAAWVREENRVYRGRATPANLDRYAGLDLQVPDVVDVLLGGPPRRKVVSTSVFPEVATSRLRLRRETPDGAQVISFAGDTLLPVEVQELDEDGVLLWRATFSSYRDTAGIALATRIGVELPASRQSAEITLNEPELNPPLDANLFLLKTPPGARETLL